MLVQENPPPQSPWDFLAQAHVREQLFTYFLISYLAWCWEGRGQCTIFTVFFCVPPLPHQQGTNFSCSLVQFIFISLANNVLIILFNIQILINKNEIKIYMISCFTLSLFIRKGLTQDSARYLLLRLKWVSRWFLGWWLSLRGGGAGPLLPVADSYPPPLPPMIIVLILGLIKIISCLYVDIIHEIITYLAYYIDIMKVLTYNFIQYRFYMMLDMWRLCGEGGRVALTQREIPPPPLYSPSTKCANFFMIIIKNIIYNSKDQLNNCSFVLEFSTVSEWAGAPSHPPAPPHHHRLIQHQSFSFLNKI